MMKEYELNLIFHSFTSLDFDQPTDPLTSIKIETTLSVTEITTPKSDTDVPATDETTTKKYTTGQPDNIGEEEVDTNKASETRDSLKESIIVILYLEIVTLLKYLSNAK